MIFSFGSLAASTPYLAATLFVIVGLWIWAARDLNVLFTEFERERSMQTMKSEISSSMDGQ
jgi:ATP/ADP translocase